jgi:hypothetical protein
MKSAAMLREVESPVDAAHDRSASASPSFVHTSSRDAELGADLLIGAEAIAKALNWKTTAGRWNRRRVYHLASQGRWPFHRVPGLGLICRKTTLDSYFKSLDERFLRSLDADSSNT